MSEVFHIGDLHFGHKNITKFRPTVGGSPVHTEEEHRERIIELWNEVSET